MDVGLDGFWGMVASVAIIVAVAYLLIVWVASVVWTYRDIASRTRDPFSQTVSLIMTIAFPFVGLLVYLPTRPRQTLAESYDHQLEAEALLHEIQEQATCPSGHRNARRLVSVFAAHTKGENGSANALAVTIRTLRTFLTFKI